MKKQIKKTYVTGAIVLSGVLLCAPISVNAKMNVHTRLSTTEKKKETTVTLYGKAYDWGSVVITESGVEYNIVDPPEFEDGTDVYIVVDKSTNQVIYIDEYKLTKEIKK